MDPVSEIAARYRATVKPGVTVRRLPTGASSRPYPVWNPEKNTLEVPDWKEEAERAKRAGIRRAHAGARRGRAQDAELMARLIAMHGQGMRPPAIGAATGLSADQVYRLLRGAGHSVERVKPGPSPVTLQRVAEIRQLVAEGKSRAAIAGTLGFKDGKALAEFCRRAAPDLKLPVDARLAGVNGAQGAGRDMGKAWAAFRDDQHARVSKLLAEGLDEAAIAAALQIESRQYLRRLIRVVAPGFVFAKADRFPEHAARDAEVRRMIATLTVCDVAARMGLTQGQVAASVRRSRAAGLLAPEVEAVRAARSRNTPPASIATRDAAILPLVRDMTYAQIADRLGLRLHQVKAAVTRLRAKGDLPPSSVERMPLRPGSIAGGGPKKPERAAAILHRHGLGRTVNQIARELGITRRAVLTELQRAGETPRNEPPSPRADHIAALPDLVAKGLTARQIADHWGKGTPYVYKLAQAAKISLGRNARTKKDPTVSFRVAARRERVRHLYAQGKTYRQMCDLLNIGKATVWRDIEALGIALTGPNVKGRAKPPRRAERRAA